MTHEMGQVLGFDHDDALTFTVMDEDLEAGARYLLRNGTGTETPTAPQEINLSDWMFDDGLPAGSSLSWNSSTGDWDESVESNRFSPFQRSRLRKGALASRR